MIGWRDEVIERSGCVARDRGVWVRRRCPANVDANGGTDAPAPDADPNAYACPATGTPPACTGTTTPPTTPVGSGGGTCDPLAQTGCAAGEKCTWILDQQSPSIGHIGCAPDGDIALGCACSVGAAGATGYDDCAKGAFCSAGTCKTICDLDGGASSCGAGGTCVRYGGLFELGGDEVAGVCGVTCDPLTQCATHSATPSACGSTDPAAPDFGCFGQEAYACSPTIAGTSALTDRMPPKTNSSGAAFVNGCAPGFIPFFYESSTNTMVRCTGLCAALEIDNTPAHAGNMKGDATAPAKLPTKATAAYGDGTCDVGKKGSLPTSMCLYIWSFLEDDIGELSPAFAASGLVDTLGVCFAYDQFQYDSNNDGSPDKPYPACNTLPPRSTATPGFDDDAADWGCLKRSSSTVARSSMNPALRQLRVGLGGPVPLLRHTFR